MAFEDVLVHIATPLRAVRAPAAPAPDPPPDPPEDPPPEWIEGEYEVTDGEAARGIPFDCCLFLPEGEEPPSARGGRKVRRPTLLFAPEDQLLNEIALSAEDELLVVAEEINVAGGLSPEAEVRWQVQGDPQPFGKPGEPLIGFQATLLRVED